MPRISLSPALAAAGLIIFVGCATTDLRAEEPTASRPIAAGGGEAATSPPGEIRSSAVRAMDDLLRHWWRGDESTGHLLATHGGCVNEGKGVIWERAIVVCAMEGLSVALEDAHLRHRIQAQWIYDQSIFSASELEACGSGSHSPWCDDADWALLYYVLMFQQTGDVAALEHAKAMAQNIHARWYDDALGGGLWYNDKRQLKSLYGVAYVYGCLGVYEATHDAKYRELALEEYQWIEAHLLRSDGLYWCDYSAGPPANPNHPLGPMGAKSPDHIGTAGSVVYLGGSMGMGACQAYLYQLTGEDAWRAAAFRTAAALREHLVDKRGCYINDRDAFTNGFFASFWARRLKALPGCEPGQFAVLRATAEAIAESRTTASYTPAYGPGGEGNYPGDWDGGSAWESKGSMANMMHVSASSIAFLVAAVYADPGR